MQKDEQAALLINKRYVAVLNQFVLSHDGEILNDFGDGSLCTFASATQAVKCAIEMQEEFRVEPKVPLRIGLHVGEIFFEDGKVFGDGVIVASRVQSLGIANSVLFSSEINSKIRNQPEFKSVSIGRFHFKNLDEPMEVFALANDGFVIPDKKNIEGKLKENKNSGKTRWLVTIAVLIFATIFFLLYNYFALNNKIKSIAVLPFINGSSDKQNEYLSDGIAQEIIWQISKISSLEVKGWGSSVYFKNSDKSLKEKAEALDAEEIVTGSIEKDSDRVLIRVELTEASTGKKNLGR
jgi:adenylate cyclase